jgi:hypothetical protein
VGLSWFRVLCFLAESNNNYTNCHIYICFLQQFGLDKKFKDNKMGRARGMHEKNRSTCSFLVSESARKETT